MVQLPEKKKRACCSLQWNQTKVSYPNSPSPHSCCRPRHCCPERIRCFRYLSKQKKHVLNLNLALRRHINSPRLMPSFLIIQRPNPT
jgi:hypothetical protein